MSQDQLITLYNKESKEHIVTRANRKKRASFGNKDFKLELKKYSKKLRKVLLFKEVKKMFGRK